jgi:GTP-binding protein
MIVGENCRDGDLVVNLAREKKLTNIRSSTKESFVKLLPPRVLTLEDGLEYVAEDELVEVTPQHIRLRKRRLKEKDRKKDDRQR